MRRSTAAFAFLVLAASLAAADDWITQPYTLQSPSPYPPAMRQVPFAIRQPGAATLKVYFEWLEFEDGWDRIEIRDAAGQIVQRFTGRAAGFWSEAVAGDTLVIVMTTDAQESGRGFLVTQIAYREGAPPPSPPAPPSAVFPSRIEILEATSAGTRRLDPFKPVELAAGGCQHSSIDLAVRGYDERDQPIGVLDFRAQVSFGTGGAEFGQLEPRGGSLYRFHAGATTVQGLIIALADPRQPRMKAEFSANITTDHNCSIQPAPPPAADPLPPPPAILEAGPLPTPPLPSGPAFEWVQVGVPYTHPHRIRRDQETDFFFAVHPPLGRHVDFKIAANAPFRIRYVRADFQGGAASAWYATHHSFVMNPGEEFHIQVLYPSRGAQLIRFKVGVVGEPGGALTLFALVPR